MPDIVQPDIKYLLFRKDCGLGNAHQVLHQLYQRRRIVIQNHLTAFNLGHIQNIINQPHQQTAGQIDFFQAVLHLHRFLQMLLRDLGHPDNGVHRRPYIMGHIGKEPAFRLICVLRRLARRFLCPQYLPGRIRVDQNKCDHNQGADQKHAQKRNHCRSHQSSADHIHRHHCDQLPVIHVHRRMV